MTRIADFGTLPDGQTVQAVTIGTGPLTAVLLTHGARLQDLRMAGVDHPLVLGSPRLEDYLGPMAAFGATVGRYANRIGGARFMLNGTEYRLDANERGRTCLHGGSDGMGRANWTLEEVSDRAVCFGLVQPDGHMGFPGRLEARARYRAEDTALVVEMEARCEADCPVSMAHHSYFTPDDAGDVAGLRMRIGARDYLAVDEEQIPLPGPPRAVAGTRFDFRAPVPLGEAGIDHCFCLQGDGLREVARITGRDGLVLTIATDAPGLQVYNAGHLPAEGIAGLEGRLYRSRAGLALETQHWPDAPNRPDFPDATLHAGETYRHVVRYGFGA